MACIGGQLKSLSDVLYGALMNGDDPDTAIGLAALMLRYLLASRRAVAPQITDGITTGAGNQGSSAFTFIGQAGTSGTQLSIPRNLRFGVTSQAIP